MTSGRNLNERSIKVHSHCGAIITRVVCHSSFVTTLEVFIRLKGRMYSLRLSDTEPGVSWATAYMENGIYAYY